MSDKTQTAVKWLIDQLNKTGFTQVVTDEEIAQAIEMEKNQINEAYIDGLINWDINKNLDYYTDTYKP
jgi:hypothetical protein